MIMSLKNLYYDNTKTLPKFKMEIKGQVIKWKLQIKNGFFAKLNCLTMKLSVSAYRAHASAHKKILSTCYQTHYGSTTQSSAHLSSGLFSVSVANFILKSFILNYLF